MSLETQSITSETSDPKRIFVYEYGQTSHQSSDEEESTIDYQPSEPSSFDRIRWTINPLSLPFRLHLL